MRHPSRRDAIKLLVGAPLLPLGGGAVSSVLTALIDAVLPSQRRRSSLPSSAPCLPFADHTAAMATTTVGSTMIVSFSDSTHDFKLAYQPVLPDRRPGAGRQGRHDPGRRLLSTSRTSRSSTRRWRARSANSSPTARRHVAAELDSADVTGIKGKAVFAVVQFEYTTRDQAGASTYGTLPSPIAVLTLDQDQTTGKLSLVKYHNVDTSAAHGLWITCGASLSPWNTHLSSEEYEPDAAFIATNDQFKAFSQNLFGDETGPIPTTTAICPK